MPSSSRDFQRAAAQRLATAQFLVENGSRYNLDATYLAGYAIECTLKALIIEYSSEAERTEKLKLITSGKKNHNPEILAGYLTDIGHPIPPDLKKRILRLGWSVDLRYEFGKKDTGETRAFLKSATAIYDWVEGQLP
ncbi:MAG TPA: HEPN domain-containing protein [Pirellulales bacterium]|nr:HEPN domain-containing protein [Pirellulales bacterium]